MKILCEACEVVPATVQEACDEGATYHICVACHSRLIAFALRPVEWFNLAKRHGWWQALLHDDFYNEDGTAYQSKQIVENPEQHLAPTLDEVSNDPNALLDYSITQWDFRQDVAAAWKALDPKEVLHTIEQRYAIVDDFDIQGVMLEIAACSLSQSGRDFVTAAWSDFREPGQLGTLAQASVACLPYNDGFSRVVRALSLYDPKTRRNTMFALFYFHSRDVLDWIESNVLSPVTEDWGRLAAGSRFSWAQAVSWLEKGRLVSLVALDALAEIVRPQSLLLRDYAPSLKDKPNSAEFQNTLESYLQHDATPRAKMTVRFLLENMQTLTLQ